MGKNQIGGKKHKKSKNTTQPCNMSRNLVLADPESEKYGYVISAMGDCRMKCYCEDRVERIGIIRGNMRKRIFISVGDVVIMSMRSFQDNKADITQVYNSEEVLALYSFGEINNINKYKTINVRELNSDNSDNSDEDEMTFGENLYVEKHKVEPLNLKQQTFTNEFVDLSSDKIEFDFDEI
jgi:translation initiation factor 1A